MTSNPIQEALSAEDNSKDVLRDAYVVKLFPDKDYEIESNARDLGVQAERYVRSQRERKLEARRRTILAQFDALLADGETLTIHQIIQELNAKLETLDPGDGA